jgi:hypothetical protein
MEKHPAFWKLEALRAKRNEAQALVLLASLKAQQADAALAAALTEAGFDPRTNWRLDDQTETITPDVVAGVKVE